jgi:lauroyl/myristoyl acyltransferase
MRSSAEDIAVGIRRRTPSTALPALVAARFRMAWSRETVRADARAQMRFVLEHTRPDADLDEVARAYVKSQIWRGELRWHPETISHLRVEGLEHLQAARELRGGVLLNFTHHGQYDGGFPSLARHGFPCHIAVHPYMLEETAETWLKQHVSVACRAGGVAVSAGIGTDGLTALLRSGSVVAIASDVPGRTPVRFVGRDVLGSFGAARLAAATGAPVVVQTFDKDAQGPFLRLHEPLLPDSFDGPKPLLEAMLGHHEAALVRWPEWADIPRSRWGLPTTNQSTPPATSPVASWSGTQSATQSATQSVVTA